MFRRPIKWHRIKKRIRQHHLPLALLTVVSVALVYWVVESRNPIFRLSMATAYASLVLLAATLMTGALNVIRNRPNPVSTDLTRDIGMWAALVSVAHVVFGLQMHFPGRMWLYFVTEDFPFLRYGLFGAANYTGLVATLIVALLLATSNDWSLRRLGTRRWKRLQRWNYGLFLLVVVHGVAYQVIENRPLAYSVVFALIAVVVVITQVAGFRQRRWELAQRAGRTNAEAEDNRSKG